MSKLVSPLAALLVAVATPALAAGPQVVATHTLVKPQPKDPVQGQAVARISAAANEMESFQAVVLGGEAGLKGVSARLSDLHGPTTIAADNAVLYRAGYMNITNLSDGNSRRGPTPDALIPDVDPYFGEKRNAFPFDVPAGESRIVWVDLHVPPGTPAGNYEGTLTLEGEGGLSQQLPVQLEVFPFELSSTPSYASSYGLAWAGTCQGHVGDQWCHGDDALFDELRQLYGIAGLNNRMSFSGVAGAFVTGGDFERYDRAYGPLLDGTANTRLPGAQLTSIEVWARDPISPADYGKWAQHFKKKGWFDKLFDYTCDEPPLTCTWESIKPKQDRVHAGDPELRSLITTTVQHLKDRGIYESTDIIVPVVNFVEGKEGEYAGDNSADYRQAVKDGKEVWIYSSCMSHGCGGTVGGEYEDPALSGWPSLAIDHTAIQNRALPWVAYKYGFSGELYWDSVYAFVTKPDAWASQWDFTGNGDGTLLYPGTPAKIGGTKHIPVESIRMKHIRDGIEDYEYLKTLEAFDPVAAEAFASKLFPHAWSADGMSPEAMSEVRREIAEEIRKHVKRHGGGNEGDDPIPPVVGGDSGEGDHQPVPGTDSEKQPTRPGDFIPASNSGGPQSCSAAGAGMTAPLGAGLVGLLFALRRRRR